MKLYDLILCDPPWLFEDWAAHAPGMVHDRIRGAARHYPCMTLEQICALRVPAAKDAVLLMWVTSTHYEQAFRVMAAWGFTFKTKAWTWLKTTRDGRPRMGMGKWTRQCTEDCLLAVRGHPPAPRYRGELGLIEAPRRRHSEKPEDQYGKIDRLFPLDVYPNRLEMFARKERVGWAVFGNEVPHSIDISYQESLPCLTNSLKQPIAPLNTPMSAGAH